MSIKKLDLRSMFWPWRDRSDAQSPQSSSSSAPASEGKSFADAARSFRRKAVNDALSSSKAQVARVQKTTQETLADGAIVTYANGSSHELYKFGEIKILLVRQPYRRRISMVHQLTGRLKVTCPKGMRDPQINEFLMKHVDWMKTNFAQFDKIRSKNPEKKYQQDELFQFMGRQLRLHLMPGGSRGDVEIIGDRLVVYLPTIGRHSASGASPEARSALIQKIVLEFYEQQGRKILDHRTKFFAQKMKLHPSSVSYRSQKTRWGSCTTRGKISLNWRLIFAPPETLDYVVIHELSHLRHHNHSAAFWNLVATECADYASHKRWLRENVYAADFLAKSSEIHPEN